MYSIKISENKKVQILLSIFNHIYKHVYNTIYKTIVIQLLYNLF